MKDSSVCLCGKLYTYIHARGCVPMCVCVGVHACVCVRVGVGACSAHWSALSVYGCCCSGIL